MKPGLAYLIPFLLGYVEHNNGPTRNSKNESGLNEQHNRIIFRGFNTNGSQFILTSGDDSNGTLLENCDPMGNYTIIVHGYTESVTTFWVSSMINNILNARGGCVLFMDYS